MPVFPIIQRAVRGILTTLIVISAAVVWAEPTAAAYTTMARAKYLLLGSVVLALVLLALDPNGFRNPERRGLAILIFPRAAIVLLSAGIAFHAGVNQWLVAAAVGLGAGALLAEPIIFRLVRTPSVWASNVPGQPEIPRYSNIFVVLVPLSVLVPISVLAGEGAGFGWWVGASALWLLLTGFVVADLIRTRIALRRAEKKIEEAVRDYDAEAIIFTSRPDDASYQISMWLPYFRRLGKRLLILATSETAARALSDITEVPVAVRRSVSSFEQMAGPSLGAIFYVNASSGNNTMVRYSQYVHVYIGHGDSDKPPSYNPTHAMYDHVFAAGQAAIDRYAAHGVHIPREKFEIVGRPQVEDVAVIDPVNRPQVRTVFYAPTWRGHVEETMFHSLHRGEAIVAELLKRGLRVIFRPHPFSYNFAEDRALIERIQKQLEDDSRKSGIEHLWGERAEREYSVMDCINDSDAMISDVSSVVSDFLYSGKPFAMMAISTPVSEFISEYPIARGAYVIGEDLAELAPALDQMTGDDSLHAVRQEVRSYYLGNFAADGYSQNFVDAAARAITAGQEKRALSRKVAREVAETHAEVPVEGTEVEQSARDVLSYRVRLLQRLTGYRQFRDSQQLAFWGLLGLIVTILSTETWSFVVVCAIAAGACGAFWWRVAKRGQRVRTQIGEPPIFFFALVVAAALHAAPNLAGENIFWWALGERVPALLGYVFLAAMLALNFETRSLQSYREVVADHLPGLRIDRTRRPAISGVVAIMSWALLLAGVGLAPWIRTSVLKPWWIIATSAGLALSVIAFVCAVIQALASRRDALELADLVAGVKPEFVVYFASNSGAKYQYGMWEPYFQRIGKPYIVISRNRQSARLISEVTDVPVIFRPTLRSLDEVIPETVTTVFYVNNGVKNTHLVERPGLTNVWLNHGDSEKPACYNPVHAMYDIIFAAGEAGIDRYARHDVKIPREKFVITGRPQVEQIGRAARDTDDLHVAGAVDGATDGPQTVLYAPTWVGPYKDTNVYSLPVAHELVSRLLERGVRVIFRAHPQNYRFEAGKRYIAEVQELLRQDAAETGRQHLWGVEAEDEMTIEDCFNASDAMICDISAVVSDYLQSEKPFAIMAMSASVDGIYADIPAARGGYVIPASLEGLDERLDDLLGADPLRPERERLRAYYLGDFPADNYADAFLTAARQVIVGELPSDPQLSA